MTLRRKLRAARETAKTAAMIADIAWQTLKRVPRVVKALLAADYERHSNRP